MSDRIRQGPLPADSAPARSRLIDAASTLGLVLSEAELDRLLAYLDLLQRWNAVYNLTAIRDPGAMLSHHLLDCLAIVPALRRQAANRPLRLLDVGSGAGLPGVIVAVMQPGWEVCCIDAVAKKVSFIRQAGADLGLGNLAAVHGRVELMRPERPFDLICSRAFASLRDFVGPTAGLLAPGGAWVAMKGDPSVVELTDLPAGVEVFHVEPLSVPGLDARRCLAWLRCRVS